jgi:DNA-binding Xre family transcriptional regulator
VQSYCTRIAIREFYFVYNDKKRQASIREQAQAIGLYTNVVGLTSRAIQMWEAKVTQPSLSFSQVADLCDFLKCTPRDLANDFESIKDSEN